MRKGEIVTILERSGSVDDWWVQMITKEKSALLINTLIRWKGKIGNRVGNFPANFVEVVGSGNNADAGIASLDPFD
jgi:hypothetical protein